MSDDKKWCPTQGGSYRAYEPQYRCSDKENWKAVPIAAIGFLAHRVPYPKHWNSVAEQIGLFGYEQAMALAWIYAAYTVEDGIRVDVRVQEYEVVYDIKARAVEDEGVAKEGVKP